MKFSGGEIFWERRTKRCDILSLSPEKKVPPPPPLSKISNFGSRNGYIEIYFFSDFLVEFLLIFQREDVPSNLQRGDIPLVFGKVRLSRARLGKKTGMRNWTELILQVSGVKTVMKNNCSVLYKRWGGGLGEVGPGGGRGAGNVVLLN